jgi:hypothetical protein
MALPRHLSPISGIDREAIMGDLSLGGKRTSDGRLVRWCSAGSVVLSWSGGAQLVQWCSAGGDVVRQAGPALSEAGAGGRRPGSGVERVGADGGGGALVGHDNGDRRTVGAELGATRSRPRGLGHAVSATNLDHQIKDADPGSAGSPASAASRAVAILT